MVPASSAQRSAARLEAREARAEQWDSMGSGYYKVECPTTIEPHPLFSFQGREPCPICLDDLCLAPAVALPCSARHAFHVKCLKEVVTRAPNPTCPNCRSPFVPTLLYATDNAARRGWHLASPSKQAVPTHPQRLFLARWPNASSPCGVRGPGLVSCAAARLQSVCSLLREN